VLHCPLLLTQLNSELLDRAANQHKKKHKSGDDGLGLLAISYSYIADTFL
jgi:hypothetical protein